MRHTGRQAVVVAVPQLLRRHRIVFVDDGNHALIQQNPQGVAGVQVAAAVFGILPRQQNLRRFDTLQTKGLMIRHRQGNLPRGRGGLFLGQIQRPLPPTQRPFAQRRGPRCDDDHALAGLMQVGHILNQRRQPRFVQPVRRRINQQR